MPNAPAITFVNIYPGQTYLNGITAPGGYYLFGTADSGDTVRIIDEPTGRQVFYPDSASISGSWYAERGPGVGYPTGLQSYYALDTTNGLRSPAFQFLVGTGGSDTLTGPTLGTAITGPGFLFGNGGADTFVAYTLALDASSSHAVGATVHVFGNAQSTVVLPIRLGALVSHAYRHTLLGTSATQLALDTSDARVDIDAAGTLRFDDAQLTVQSDVLADFLYYDQRYPDLAAADVNARAHYSQYGWQEGRDPDAYFSTQGYLGAYGDVRAAGYNPLDHYDATGWKEGRDPSALFDTRLYLIFNPDVARAGMDPLQHYLAFGIGEGRKASPVVASSLVRDGFDPLYYALANPDVSLSGLYDPLTHWQQFGAREGRNPDAFFDTGYYLAHNPDVAASGMNALGHYNQFGWHEGRDPSSHFGTSAYLAANPDIAASGMNPLQHFLAYGAAEGRSAHGNLY